MNEPAVRLTDVGRRHRSATALRSVTADLPAGTVCGLLGRNGAGKTSLMALLAGHDRPTSGRVEVFGHDPFEHVPAAGGTSFIRDNQRYPDDFRVPHVLRAARRFHAGWDDALAAMLVDAFALPSRTTVKRLSRGQLSGLGIVVGLASRAPLTIFDEPYLGLDVTARHVFADRLLAVRLEEGDRRTIVLSTHLVDEMERLLDRVIVLDRGRLVREGAVDEVTAGATTISGPADAVRRVAAGRTVLSTRSVGGLLSVVVTGGAMPEAEGRAAGVELAPVGLQDLVAVLGTAPTDEEVAA